MVSELTAYALLASVFIVTGLRMFVEKPNKLTEIPLFRWKQVVTSKRSKAGSSDL